MPIYALADCNNFYASCERVFNPALEKKPILVLSNNDGCIVARSNEAKALDIPMGAPFYQYRDLCNKHGISVFSSNYELYGDISQRVMDSLRKFCADMEVYSIDEAFLQLDGFQHLDLNAYAGEIRQKIKMWTGVPISIGIAHTKTLAKLANYIAKRRTQTGVFDLRDDTARKDTLNSTAAKEIWGIGNRLSDKLEKLGIKTAQDLADSNLKVIRQHFGVTVERIILELNGTACLNLETSKPKRNIIASRSFGKPITDFQDLAEAVSHHTARACRRLRQKNSKAQGIYVFTNDNGAMHGFVEPISETCLIIQAAKNCLKKIYRPHYQYKKCGIILMDILPDSHQQTDLFIQKNSRPKFAKLMEVMDRVNEKNGNRTLFIAAEGIKSPWQMRSNSRSPRYTTNWNELAKVIG